MLTYAEYRTKFMVRTAQQLRSKKPINTNIITLPRASLIHYVSDSQSEYGIRRSHPLLVNDTVPIRVYHVDELKVATGRPIKRTVNTIQMLNNYFKEATGSLTRIRHLDRTMKEVRAIVVLDYSLLPVKYYYPKTKTSFFDELDNIFNTQISKINEIGESREQFIVFKLPKVVPQYAKLRILPDPIPSGKLNEWKDHEAYGLLYIWRLLNKQSIIKPEAAKKLTLVFQEGGYVTQVNCADLFAWYNEDPLNTEKSLYKVWTQLQNTRIGDIPEEEETSADPTNNKASELEPDEDIDGVSSSIDSDYANDIEDEEIPAFVNIHTLNETMRDLANAGKLSGAEQKRFVKIAKSYVDIPNPVGEGTLKDLLEVPTKYKTLDPYKEIIPSKPGLVDKSMTRSTMDEFTKNYVRHVMQADIAASILSVQNAGVLVKDYKVTNTVDALNNYDTHTVSLIPINGKPSTISIKLPVVNEEGEFLANSVVRKLDSQKSDIPIRKINHSKVALTSYYGKVFVNRSGKAVDSYSRWIANKITNAAMDVDNTLITDIVFSTSAIPKNKLPRAYTAVGESIARFVTHDYSFNFNYKAREKLYGKDVVERIEKTGAVICGKVISEKDTYLSMGVDGTIFKVPSNNNALVLGSLPSIINSEWGEGPVEFATVRVFGKNVPLVIVLSSILGLDKVLEMLKVPHRWAEGSDQTKYTSNEMRIRFSGESLIIDKRHAVGAMVIAGLHAVRHVIKEYTGSDLNRKDIYGHILESVGIGRHVLREIGLMNRMFIDPITKEILEDRKEPTTFIGLLLMAADLLTTDEHPDEMDPAFMRIRGYERFTGFIYNQLIGAIRTHETSHNPSRSQVSINPTAVWGDLLADPAIVLVEESNPIHNLKEKESVTFSGQGGRSGETMVARTRVFHENDVGLISESTPDSGKVGIRSYLAPNAKLANVRGLSNRFDYSKDTLTNALSSTSLINPGTVHMDGKRVSITNC